MKRILVVEDDEAINKLICMNLNVAGYETVSVFDGAAAKAALASLPKLPADQAGHGAHRSGSPTAAPETTSSIPSPWHRPVW